MRKFVATPRSLLAAPMAWLFGRVLLRKAVAIHNAAVAAVLNAAR